MSLATATQRIPFSNGTEGEAWMDAWCAYCVHDHDMHEPDSRGPGCDLIAQAMLGDDGPDGWVWPEAWLPEPDDGEFSLPSRLCCGMFKPCTEDTCQGDPGSEARAERMAEVAAYWVEHR